MHVPGLCFYGRLLGVKLETHIRIHIHMYVYTYTCAYTRTHVRIHVHMYVYTYICKKLIHTLKQNVRTYTQIHKMLHYVILILWIPITCT